MIFLRVYEEVQSIEYRNEKKRHTSFRRVSWHKTRKDWILWIDDRLSRYVISPRLDIPGRDPRSPPPTCFRQRDPDGAVVFVSLGQPSGSVWRPWGVVVSIKDNMEEREGMQDTWPGKPHSGHLSCVASPARPTLKATRRLTNLNYVSRKNISGS